MSVTDDPGVQERQSLLSKLLDSVKQCQIRFGGRTELATENDSRVVCLCAQFEAVLQHGMRKSGKGFLPLRHVTGMMKGLNILNETDQVFWQLIRLVLNKHEFERYMLLKHINTDIGRGRAWLRSALNEHSLERYMHMILADTAQIRNLYEDWAFLMDQERSSMLPMMAAGLGSILFAISIDNPDLNIFRPSSSDSSGDATKCLSSTEDFEPKPVISKSIENGNGKKKRKKKRPTSQIVSFDEDDLNNDYSGLSEHTTLTPIGDSSVGELIPVIENEDAASDDSVSIPSFCDDVDNAVAALAVAQRVPSWSVSSTGSQGSSRSQPRSRTETLTMSAEELREALLSVMQKKEEFEERNNALRCLLEREMEMAAGLRAELEDSKRTNEEKIERLDMKIQTVTRENELLKHQLKKYIAAVQMLKHDSGKVHELAAMFGDIQPPIPEPKIFIDHQHEANEYEKKLVQVAEMHGELMEFNERLHRLLLQREAVIRRLKEELIDLRGPLPDDNQTSDDDISITSDYDASSQTASLRPLINVWIPSAFLTGKTADIHHVYQVYVRIRDDEWNVYRRYAQFYALHKMLKKRDPIVNTFDFPPKKTIGKKDAKVVEQRRRRLQHYLRCVLNWLLQTNADISNSPDKETFVSLLPFFSDQVSTQSKQLPNNRARASDNVMDQDQQSVPHYTGL